MTVTSGDPSEPDFSKMEAAAREAAADPAVVSPSATDNPDVPQTALTESYKDQVAQNMTAHREMRWIAFCVVGVLCAMYLLALLFVLLAFLDGKLLAGVIGAGANINWHVLVLVGIGLVIFAAIPLSLAMALVRMISDKDADSSAEIKLPTSELIKILIDLLKSAKGG